MAVCGSCQMGADAADEYRTADAEWRENNPREYKSGKVTQWLVIRLRRAYVVHCKAIRGERGIVGCTCQCRRPPELENEGG